MSSYYTQDPHEVLGLEKTAGVEEIRTAWREAARRHHPDAGGDAEQFKLAQWAFETLLSGGDTKGSTRRRQPDEARERDVNVKLDGEVGERAVVEIMVEHAVAVFGGPARISRWRQIHCLECSGSGVRCDVCNGDGRVGMLHEILVDVPKRSMHGESVVLHGEGDAGRRRRDDQGRAISNAGPYGDLEVRILVDRAGWIAEVGDDLVTDLRIDVYDALLGTETRVKGLDGSHVANVPPGSQPGQRIKIPGKGRPKPDGGRGDLIAVLQVEMFSNLTSFEKAVIEDLRKGRKLRGGS